MLSFCMPAFAKINLTLDVGQKRSDGYHEICSVMQTVDLADTLSFFRTPEGISIDCDSLQVPPGSGNLAYRALEMLSSRLGGGVRLEIRKRIPVAAGLGGGSSDAAAALKGANVLYGLGLKEEKLISYAARLGSDVPFFILGGTVLARGRGEKVSRLVPCPELWLVLVKPDFGVSTKDVYAHYKPEMSEPRTPMLLAALERGCRDDVVSSLGNDLEKVTFKLYPEVGILKEKLDSVGSEKSVMAGSGPTVFGVFPGEDEARRAARELQGLKVSVFICKTISV